MLTFYNKYKGGKYSQNGESGIIDEVCRRIGLAGGVATEFGAPTKEYCSNIFHLTINPEWTCLYYDPAPNEPGIIKQFITPENVNEVILTSNILSIDIDGNDYSVWKALKQKPDIVIIEINSSIAPLENYPVSDLAHGTAYKPMVELGISKGYFLLCHTGNLIFVLNKHRNLFPEITGDGVGNWEKYFQIKWLE